MVLANLEPGLLLKKHFLRRLKQCVLPLESKHIDGQPCSICTSHYKCPADTPRSKHHAVQLSCGHVFGTRCLLRWLDSTNTCPMCRGVLFQRDRCRHPHHFENYLISEDEADEHQFTWNGFRIEPDDTQNMAFLRQQQSHPFGVAWVPAGEQDITSEQHVRRGIVEARAAHWGHRDSELSISIDDYQPYRPAVPVRRSFDENDRLMDIPKLVSDLHELYFAIMARDLLASRPSIISHPLGMKIVFFLEQKLERSTFDGQSIGLQRLQQWLRNTISESRWCRKVINGRYGPVPEGYGNYVDDLVNLVVLLVSGKSVKTLTPMMRAGDGGAMEPPRKYWKNGVGFLDRNRRSTPKKRTRKADAAEGDAAEVAAGDVGDESPKKKLRKSPVENTPEKAKAEDENEIKVASEEAVMSLLKYVNSG